MFVVGKLIKTCGSGWEEEVPAILRSDRSSLIDTAQGAQPMNLHSRVIQSGLRLASFVDINPRKLIAGLKSITGPESEQIVLLLTGMAVVS